MRSRWLLPILAGCGSPAGSRTQGDASATDTLQDVSSPADLRPDARPDALPDALPDARPDALPDARPDALPDALPDAPLTDGGGTAVTTYQYDMQRTGANRAERRLTPANVRPASFGRDPAFAPALDGDVYAQPLYLPGLVTGGASRDVLFVATQANSVYALDAATGATLWRTGLGTPVARATQPCGDIAPTTGVLGTPVIDPVARTLYAVAFTSSGGARTFTLNALDVATGVARAGYPVAIHPPVSNGSTFDPNPTGERGALALVDGRIYVPFGGLSGDCGNFHGWVVGINAVAPVRQTAFATTGYAAGIWAPGGVSADGAGHLYATTGNGTTGTGPTAASMGEFVFRLGAGPAGPTMGTAPADYFAPSDRRTLDAADLDLGSVAPVVVPGTHLLFQGGKAGVAYLLDRDNLGGLGTGDGNTGEGLYSQRLFSGENVGAAAAWAGGGEVYLFMPGTGARSGCTGANGVMALRVVRTGTTTRFAVAWCTASIYATNPPVVSSNGDGDAVLWLAGATTATTPPSLRAVRVADGTEIYVATGADAPPSVRHWVPPVVADGRVYLTGYNSLALYHLR